MCALLTPEICRCTWFFVTDKPFKCRSPYARRDQRHPAQHALDCRCQVSHANAVQKHPISLPLLSRHLYLDTCAPDNHGELSSHTDRYCSDEGCCCCAALRATAAAAPRLPNASSRMALAPRSLSRHCSSACGAPLPATGNTFELSAATSQLGYAHPRSHLLDMCLWLAHPPPSTLISLFNPRTHTLDMDIHSASTQKWRT